MPLVGGSGWSLSTAQSSFTPAGMIVGGFLASGSPEVLGSGAVTIGGYGGYGVAVSDPEGLAGLYPSSVTVGPPDPNSPTMRLLNTMAGSGMSLALQSTLLGMATGSALTATTLAPRGVTASLGAGGSIIYEDRSGGRSRDLGSFYVDPSNGNYYTHR
jgi:hypothetical protein